MDFADMNFRLIVPELFLFLWSRFFIFIFLGHRDKKTPPTGLLSIIGLI